MRKFFVFAAVLLTLPLSTFPQSSDPKGRGVELANLLNSHRISVGLKPLEVSDKISKTALAHSLAMERGRVPVGHKGFEKRVEEVRRDFGGVGFSESIAYGNLSSQQVLASWLRSAENRSSIEGDFTHMGVGVAPATGNTFYYTLIYVKTPILMYNPNDPLEVRHNALEHEIIVLVNRHRVSIGLNELIGNAMVSASSREHSHNMALGRVPFSHDGFSNRVEDIKKGFGGRGFAENVAFGQNEAKTVVEGWLNSPGHRKNIEGDFTHIGVGVADAPDGTLYHTQIFVKK